jgi:hypothetical protein
MATADIEDPSTELEHPPASLKSPVWRYFGFAARYVDNVRVVDKKATVCKLCYVRVPYSSTGNTTNMAAHLRFDSIIVIFLAALLKLLNCYSSIIKKIMFLFDNLKSSSKQNNISLFRKNIKE